MKQRIVGPMIGLLLLLAPVTANAARSDVIDLADYPMEKVWRSANSRVTTATDANGEHIWRWEIGSGEAFLWLNEELPVHRDLPRFQRLLYEVNFAQGQINQFWPRTVGVLQPPFDKLLCEWNLFYFTHPHKQWIAYQQVLNDPSWFAHHFSQIPPDIRLRPRVPRISHPDHPPAVSSLNAPRKPRSHEATSDTKTSTMEAPRPRRRG